MERRLNVELPYNPRQWQRDLHAGLENHRFAVAVVHRRGGKTVGAVNHLIKQAARCHLDRPRFGYVAPLFTQAKQIAWDYLKHYTSPIPQVVRNESELWVGLPGGARIRLYGADNPDSLRGLYFDGLVLDEVAQIKPAVWYEVLRPALADRGGFAVFIGTPKGRNLLFELYHHALADPAWYAGLWTVNDTGALAPDELADAKKSMSESQFAQEFLCDWAASSDDVLIPLPLALEAARRTQPQAALAHAPLIFGVDPARFGDDRSVLLARRGLAVVELLQWRELSLMALAGRVAAQIKRLKPAAVFVDEVGLGAGVVDRLRQLGHQVVGVNGGSRAVREDRHHNLRAEMWLKMRDWLAAGGAIPDDPRLIADLTGITYGFDHNGRYLLEKKSELKSRGLASPDAGDALALTFAMEVAAPAAGDQNDPPVVADYDVLNGVPGAGKGWAGK